MTIATLASDRALLLVGEPRTAKSWLSEQLAAADNVGEAASTLLSIVLADVDELFAPALAAVDTTSSQGSDLPALARAANALHLLVKYGAARRCAPSLFADLLERVFVRAALLLPDAAVVGDDAVKAVADGVKLLHELAGNSPFPSDREASGQGLPDWLLSQRLYLVAESEAAHPTLAGLTATLLYLSWADLAQELHRFREKDLRRVAHALHDTVLSNLRASEHPGQAGSG